MNNESITRRDALKRMGQLGAAAAVMPSFLAQCGSRTTLSLRPEEIKYLDPIPQTFKGPEGVRLHGTPEQNTEMKEIVEELRSSQSPMDLFFIHFLDQKRTPIFFDGEKNRWIEKENNIHIPEDFFEPKLIAYKQYIPYISSPHAMLVHEATHIYQYFQGIFHLIGLSQSLKNGFKIYKSVEEIAYLNGLRADMQADRRSNWDECMYYGQDWGEIDSAYLYHLFWSFKEKKWSERTDQEKADLEIQACQYAFLKSWEGWMTTDHGMHYVAHKWIPGIQRNITLESESPRYLAAYDPVYAKFANHPDLMKIILRSYNDMSVDVPFLTEDFIKKLIHNDKDQKTIISDPKSKYHGQSIKKVLNALQQETDQIMKDFKTGEKYKWEKNWAYHPSDLKILDHFIHQYGKAYTPPDLSKITKVHPNFDTYMLNWEKLIMKQWERYMAHDDEYGREKTFTYCDPPSPLPQIKEGHIGTVEYIEASEIIKEKSPR